MHEIIYLRADFEPWWMLEGWEQEVISREIFDTAQQAAGYLEGLKQKLAAQYPESKSKAPAFYAYWKEGETEYCEDCGEDLQIYHGLVWLQNGTPVESI